MRTCPGKLAGAGPRRRAADITGPEERTPPKHRPGGEKPFMPPTVLFPAGRHQRGSGHPPGRIRPGPPCPLPSRLRLSLARPRQRNMQFRPP